MLVITLENCTTIHRTPSQGTVWRDFSIFEGTKFFYYRHIVPKRHSAQKCIKYPFDSRAHWHLKTVRRLWFSTSSRLETWLIPFGTIVTQPALVLPLVVLISALSSSFVLKRQDKVQKKIVWGQGASDYG